MSATAAVEPAPWRPVAAWTLVAVASIIAFAATLNVWVKRQVLDSNHWTKTTSAMLRDREIRGALSVYVVDQLYTRVNIPAALERGLPKRLGVLAVPLSIASEQAAMRGVDHVLEQPRFQRLWEKASRRAHTLFLDVIDDRRMHARFIRGKVVLDLHPLVEQLALREGLSGRAARAVPPEAGRLVIMRSSQLEAAQTGVRVVRALSYVLSVVALALYALAVYVAGRGRRSATILGIGFAVLAVGVLVLVARRLVGEWVVSSLTANPDFETASAHAWAIGSSLLSETAVSLIAYGAAIAGAAWIAGPSRTAIAVRRSIAPTLREHPAVIYGVLALALPIFLAVGPLDGNRLVPLLALFGFACLGGEAFRRQTAREFPPRPDGSTAASNIPSQRSTREKAGSREDAP